MRDRRRPKAGLAHRRDPMDSTETTTAADLMALERILAGAQRLAERIHDDDVLLAVAQARLLVVRREVALERMAVTA